MSSRREVLINTYPNRYGLQLNIDNQQIYMESGKIEYLKTKLFKVVPFSKLEMEDNGYTLITQSGTEVLEGEVYKAFPFNDDTVDKTRRYQYKYDLSNLYYVIKDIRNNNRYIDIEFEKVIILDSNDNDVSNNFEPIFIIKNKEIEITAGYLAEVHRLQDNLYVNDNGFLNNFYVLAEFIMPQQEVVGLGIGGTNPSIYDYAEYQPIDLLNGSMFVDMKDGYLFTDQEIRLGRMDQFEQVLSSTMDFYMFVRGYLNVWDNPEEFGTIYIDYPYLENVSDWKYQTEQVGFYNGEDYLIQNIFVEIITNTEGERQQNYYILDFYSKFIESVPEVIDARNIYTRRKSGDQEVLILNKQFNSLGERLDSTYQEIEEIQKQVNMDLPTSISNNVQQLYEDISQLENSVDEKLLAMQQSVNSVLSYAKTFQKMGDVLRRPTITLYNSIQPHITNRNSLNIEYATLQDRLNAIDKDIYSNVFSIKDILSRLQYLESMFKQSQYSENIQITRNMEINGFIELSSTVSTIDHITIEYTEDSSLDISQPSSFNFANYYWVVGAQGQISETTSDIIVRLDNKIIYQDIPLGIETKYTIDNVPIMVYNHQESSPGLKQFIKNTKEIISQTSTDLEKINIAFIDDDFIGYDNMSSEHDQMYNDYSFVAGDFWIRDMVYFDIEQEKRYLQNSQLMLFEFYPNSNAVGNDPYMKSNGEYIDYSTFMSYIQTIRDNYEDESQTEDDIQPWLQSIFQGKDFIYTFEIEKNEDANKYDVRFHYLLKKFEIQGEPELLDTGFFRVRYMNRKLKGYLEKEEYEEYVNNSWQNILLGNYSSLHIDAVYDENNNQHNNKTFYVLRTVSYRANKLQEDDTRNLIIFIDDFSYRIRKDRFFIDTINGEKFEYYTVSNIRTSYLQRSERDLNIQNNIITMPHYNIYQGTLGAEQVRSYFEIAKRLNIYKSQMITQTPLKNFYDVLIQNGDTGGYNINVKGVVEIDAITALDNRLTEFRSSYEEVNRIIFGTILLVDDTYIQFGQNQQAFGDAVFNLRFDGITNDKLYLDSHQLFAEGSIFDIGQQEIDISYLSYGSSIMHLYQNLIRSNNTGTYSMTTGIIPGDQVRLATIMVYKDVNPELCFLRVEQENIFYSPFKNIYTLSQLEQSFNMLSEEVNTLNMMLLANPSFINAEQVEEIENGYYVFERDSVETRLKSYYDYIDEIEDHINGVSMFDHVGKEITEKSLIPFAITEVADKYNESGIDYIEIKEWITDIDIVVDGIRMGIQNDQDFSEPFYRQDGFGVNKITIDNQTEEHFWDDDNNEQRTKYQYSGEILKKHDYQQRRNFLVERFYIPADYEVNDLRYRVKYQPETGYVWNNFAIVMNKVEDQDLDLMRQDFYLIDNETQEYEAVVNEDGELVLSYNVNKRFPYKIYPEQVKDIVIRYRPDITSPYGYYLVYSSDPSRNVGSSLEISQNGEQLIIRDLPNFMANQQLYSQFNRVEVYFEGVFLSKFDDYIIRSGAYLRNINPSTVSFVYDDTSGFYMMDEAPDEIQAQHILNNFFFQKGRYIYAFTSEYETDYGIKTIQQFYKIPLNVIDCSDPQQNIEIIGKPVQPYTIHDTFRYSIYGYAQRMSDNIQEQFGINLPEDRFVYKLKAFRGQQFNNVEDNYVYAPIFFMHVDIDWQQDKIVLLVYDQSFSVLDIIEARYSQTNLLLFSGIGNRFEWIESYLKRRYEGNIGESIINSMGEEIVNLDINNYTTSDLIQFENTYIKVGDTRLIRDDSWKFIKTIFQVVEDNLTIQGNTNFNEKSYNDVPILLADIKIDESIQTSGGDTDSYTSQDAHKNNSGRELQKRFAYAVYYDDLIAIDKIS